MNANELAVELERYLKGEEYDRLVWEIPDFLRQQQAEIEALKQIIDANNLNQNIGQFVKPTNKPVAWMDDCSFFTEQPDDMDGVIPLYTHPVKELTDEEIMVLYEEYIETQYASESNVLGFGRAILRKAQE